MLLMYHVPKREAVLRISPCFPLLICLIRLAASSSPTFQHICTLDLHMQSKWNSVNFPFLVETAATCILDYTLYIHEKGKYNPLEKKIHGEFSVPCSIAFHPTWLITYPVFITSSKEKSPHFTVLTNLRTEAWRYRVRKEISFPWISCI